MTIKSLFLLCFLTVLNITNITSQEIHITPRPQKLIIKSGVFKINNETQIVFNDSSKKIVKDLQNYFSKEFNITTKLTEYQNLKNNFLAFQIDESFTDEAYDLTISDNNIIICANSKKGWFYGLQTLKQLCSFNAYYSKYEKYIEVKNLKIEDKPNFKWRAFMLDEARYFKGMEQVKMLLDEMAYLKMNVFHWHLVDDQG